MAMARALEWPLARQWVRASDAAEAHKLAQPSSAAAAAHRLAPLSAEGSGCELDVATETDWA